MGAESRLPLGGSPGAVTPRPPKGFGVLAALALGGTTVLLCACTDGRPLGDADGGMSGGADTGSAGTSGSGSGGSGTSGSGTSGSGTSGSGNGAGASNGGSTSTPPPPMPAECLPSGQLAGLALREIVGGLREPIFVTSAPGDSTRLYIVEQAGRVRLFENGQVSSQPFLDITSRVINGGERGLLGLAFHPGYAQNGRFFVHYSAGASAEGINQGDGVVAELSRSSGSAASADPASERRVLVIPQPFENHNGGMLAFSPRDGFLYIGLGDGGSADDPQGNGQSLSTWLGKMLRIDIDAPTTAQPYAIPAGNMAGAGARPEIWSYGLRNPWRYSFDPCSGDLYIGDVGQNQYEEIDYEPANAGGRNYGWSVMEGNHCLDGDTCNSAGMTPPVAEYTHNPDCSVTGGYVYRGSAIPALRGYYVYADYCSGKFWRLRIENGQATGAQEITSDINPEGVQSISSFGVDAAGELLVVSRGGSIYRIVSE